MLELLAEARDAGRPALVLTARRVVEVLGCNPDAGWWAEHEDAWAAAGFTVSYDADRAWVTATPLPTTPGPTAPLAELPSVEPTEVHLVLTWAPPTDRDPEPGVWRRTVRGRLAFGAFLDRTELQPGDLIATLSVADAERSLADPDVRAMAVLAARLQSNLGADLSGGAETTTQTTTQTATQTATEAGAEVGGGPECRPADGPGERAGTDNADNVGGGSGI